jgi:alpha-ribazole phosphatase
MKTLHVYLLRHGETEYNREKRYQGTRDIPLSEKGRAELVRAEIEPETVVVSPLTRARQTAEVLFPAARQQVEPDLREMCFGVFEGRNYIEMEHDPDYRAWVGEDCVGRCPGGESRAEFSARTCAAFEKLVEAAFEREEDALVIVAHGGTQMAVMERYALPHKDYYRWCGPNAGGYVLEIEPDRWREEHTMRLVDEVQYVQAGQQAAHREGQAE